jgi:hypothetical protein
MTPEKFLKLLIEAGGTEKLSGVINLPGAGVHRHVAQNTSKLRECVDAIAQMSKSEQASIVKAIALYEETVGGLGSATFLNRISKIVDDPRYALFDWVVNNTTSYDHFSEGAKSLAELQAIKKRRAAGKIEREKVERKRQLTAKHLRAERAERNIVKAIQRGDIKAVEALLLKGANPDMLTADGVSLAQFAESVGQIEIAKQLRDQAIL